MDKLIKNIEDLPDCMQRQIHDCIQHEMDKVLYYKEEREEELINYIDLRIDIGNKAMFKMIDFSNKDGYELLQLSKIYVINKECKKALLKFKEDYLKKHAKDNAEEPNQIRENNLSSAKRKAHTTDFSQIRRFEPTIYFEMEELYKFLIREKVINNCDYDLFNNCISHAHIKELWENGKHNQLKCVIRELKDKYEKDWFDNVSSNLGKSKRILLAINRDSLKKMDNNGKVITRFEDRLWDILNKKKTDK